MLYLKDQGLTDQNNHVAQQEFSGNSDKAKNLNEPQAQEEGDQHANKFNAEVKN